MSFSGAVKDELRQAVVKRICCAESESYGALIFSAGSGEELDRRKFDRGCCIPAFLRGAFLFCGTVSNPEKQYRLELVVSDGKKGRALCEVLSESGFIFKSAQRGGVCVIYTEDSGQIEDFLTFIGAKIAALEVMGAKITKDMRNKVNRKVNFETANIGRTVGASAVQTEAIETIETGAGIKSLPEDLRTVAAARLDNPESSLSELSEILGISRSAVNRRLARIIKISKQ